MTNTELFDQLFSNTTGILQIQLLISKESPQSVKTTHVCIKNPKKVFPFKVFRAWAATLNKSSTLNIGV